MHMTMTTDQPTICPLFSNPNPLPQKKQKTENNNIKTGRVHLLEQGQQHQRARLPHRVPARRAQGGDVPGADRADPALPIVVVGLRFLS